MEFFKKIVSAGLGAAILTEEKITQTLDELVKKGELSEQEGKTAAKEIYDRIEENRKFIEDKVNEQFEKVIKKVKLATDSDIEKLEKRIEKLESLLREKNSGESKK